MNKHEKRAAARLEARKKAEAIVSRMSIEEKCSQLRYDAPAIEHLGIPEYNWWNEGLHGVARAGVATVFPQAIGMAATFDVEMVEAMGDCVAVEGRAKYNASVKEGDHDIYKGLTFWSPNINIFRDPRWGRGHETYGEDPYLTTQMGLAFVKGLQGEEDTLKAAGCAKHYAVHSGPEGIRHEFNAIASAKDMEETYLPAFEALVKEGDVEAVMGAYNRTNGEACCGSKTLLADTLRGKWGFKGHVVSDCWAIADFHTRHMVTATPEESVAMALGNGCDLNCGNTYLHMMEALKEGLITEEQINEAAIRLFTTRYLLGIMPDSEGTPYSEVAYTEVESPEHIALSLKAAEESLVLLMNKGILPLNADAVKTIGVIGPNANSRAALIGNYHGTSSEYITVLEGIREYTKDRCRILFSEGSDLFRDKTEPLSAYEGDRISEALTVARNSDVVVLVTGLDETLEGEEGDTGNSYASGDKNDLLLPEAQRRLMEAIASVDVPVILINMTGSAMDLRFADEHFDAIVQSWYPGARGGRAIARMLFGDISPAGKLPVTFYDNDYALPDFTDYSMKGRTYRYMEGEAQYPFGYGLTYGDVSVTEVTVEKTGYVQADPESTYCMADDGRIFEAELRVTVKNEGNFDTDEVVQVYVNSHSKDAPANPILAAFRRIRVPAGGTETFDLTVSDPAFTVVTEDGRRVRADGKTTLYVGCTAPDNRSVTLAGHVPYVMEIVV